jgi:hypothetical protein
MFQRFWSAPGHVAFKVAKAAAAIAFLSLIAVNWLSSTVARHEPDRAGLTRLAGSAAHDKSDTMITGSLAKRAQAVRLDPCTGERRN